MQQMTRRIDISSKTVFFIAAFLILLWVIFQILDIILLFFIAFIFMSALSPVVDQLTRIKVPRIVAVLVVFLVLVSLLVGLVTLGFSPLIAQTSSLAQRLADTIGNLLQANLIDQSVIRDEMSKLSGQVVNITVDIFKNIISFVSLLVITVYMLLDREKIEDYGTSFFGVHQEKARRVLRRIEDKLGAWLRGQIVLSLIIGVASYVGLKLLGVEFALPLAIIAGMLEVVPVIGPIISAIPAILIALTVSPLFATIVAGLYLAIQQLEGHLVVPQVMKKAVGLNPLLVILAISVGGRLLGLGGALLAVPISVVVQLVTQEIIKPSE